MQCYAYDGSRSFTSFRMTEWNAQDDRKKLGMFSSCHLERNEVKSKDLKENSSMGNRSFDYADAPLRMTKRLSF